MKLRLQRLVGPLSLASAALASAMFAPLPASAQVAPSAGQVANYRGLHAAVANGDTTALKRLLATHPVVDARDAQGRTPLHLSLIHI